jgi:transposase
MRQKLINDNQLLEMYRAGKLQREIAEHFKVSPVAISKRLKRLLPQADDVLDKYRLTKKEKNFVVQKAKGKSNTQAALETYEAKSRTTAKVIGSQLMEKENVKLAIDELMDVHGLTKSYRVSRLRDHVDNRDPNISLKALDQTWRLDGSYKPEDEGDRYNVLIINQIKDLQARMRAEGINEDVIDVTPEG